jgi:putative SOS response-associated peptidase YedK
MVRRSTPQKQIDDQAFPVRIFLKVPERGLNMTVIHPWLAKALGRENYAVHGGGCNGNDQRAAFYFRHPDHAAQLLAAFPDLVQLSDGTASVTYQSPFLPFGRLLEDEPVCNLYSMTRAQDAVRQFFAGIEMADHLGNLPAAQYYPDQMAPIIRHAASGFEMVKARWGMPSPAFALKTARDPGVTNVRNLSSPHWRRWLGPAHRCLVPITSFAEPKTGGNQWFAPMDDRQAFFAGIEVRGWKSLRKVKDGETTDDLFAFLTCAPNAEVAGVHPKAMPVILTERADAECWMTAPFEMAIQMQRPLPDGSLRLIDGPI